VEHNPNEDPRIAAIPDIHGHAKGEHKPFAEERPIPYTARMLFLWFFHACRRSSPRFMMVADHINYLTFEDPAAVNLVRRALKLAHAGDLYGAAETAGVELAHAAVVSEGLRRGMRFSIGAEVDNDPRSRPDAQNIVDAMKPDGVVRAIHFLTITHPQHGENWAWAFDNPEFRELYDVVGTEAVWELYVATLLEAIRPNEIVAHFYVPAKFGHWPDEAVLEAYEDRLIETCAERGAAIEVNSRYFYRYFAEDETNLRRFRAAHLRLMRKAKERGVMIAVGSDAHSPKDQGGGFEAVLALLDEADINEIAFPLGGRLARVALRATDDVLRRHQAALAQPPTAERAPSRHAVAVAERVANAAEAAAAAASGESTPSEPSEATAASEAAAEVPAAVSVAPRRKARPAKAVAVPAAGEPAATAAQTPVAAEAAVEAPVADAEPAKPTKPATRAARPVRPAATADVAEPAVKAVAKPVAAKATAPAPKPEKRPALKARPAGARAVAKPASKVATRTKPATKPAAKKSAAKPAKAKPATAKAKTAAKRPVAKKAAIKPALKKAAAKKSAARVVGAVKKAKAASAARKPAKATAKRPAAKAAPKRAAAPKRRAAKKSARRR
jgi:HisJ family histidinol phosphate phosphatase